ncbi:MULTISPECIES: glycosyltransferase [Acinetobacter]|uniref:glycosyltransferase n=1 Tax=Acinetobacter TaxID=469 RepID=UPI00257AD855|nr:MULTISPECIES: glycosyltransferase [Acinetobacter]
MNLKNVKPLVTVYIPTYNRVNLLKRAVESVRQQTYTNVEIIIVDDCSTDGTYEYLKNISKQDSRIKFFLKEKNSGACVSRNIAIKNATGEFITGLDDDDYFLPSRIAKFVEYRYLLDEYVFIYSLNYIENNGIRRLPAFSFLIPRKAKAKDLLQSNIVGNQCFIQTEIMREYGLFSENLKAWQDLDLWYKLLSNPKLKKKAIRVDNKTYIQDISHEFGRISSERDKSKMRTVYINFIENNNLEYFERKILAGHLISYNCSVKKINFIIRFLTGVKPYFFLKNLWLLFSKIRNKL